MFFGLILAFIALFAWGFIVIPLKKTETSGLYGLGISLIAGLAVLLVPSLFLLFSTNIVSIKTLFFIVLVGILQFPLATFLYYESIRIAGLSIVAPLTRLKTLFVTVFVLVFGIEAITRNDMIAAVLAIIGAVMLTSHSIKLKHIHDGHVEKGALYSIGAAVSWGAGDLAVQKVAGQVHPLVITFIALFSGMIVYYLYIGLKGKFNVIINMPRSDKYRYATHGIISFGIGYLAYFAAIGRIGVTKSVIITTGWPLIAMVMGFILFKEKFTLFKKLGGILLIVSVILTMI